MLMTQTSDDRATTQARRRPLPDLDLSGLQRGLQAAVRGEVRFDTASRAMYASDGSNFRQVPIGVVIPRTLDDIVAAHRVCADFGAPIVNRAAGPACPVRPSITPS
jgi:FAD/FMN-containing dehydrogenase